MSKRPSQTMPRRLLLAMGLVSSLLLPLSAEAVITWGFGDGGAPIFEDFSGFTNSVFAETPIALSRGAQVSAYFAGQTPDTVGPVSPNPSISPDPADKFTFDDVTGSPTGSRLALASQPSVPCSPLTPGCTDGRFNNVAVVTFGTSRVSGWLDNETTGMLAFLFAENITTFGIQIYDSGISTNQPDDSEKGPITFTFFGRDPNASDFLIGAITFTAQNGPVWFESDTANIAGVHITHRDPHGLTYDNIRVVPATGTFALAAAGFLGFGVCRRRTPRTA